MPDLDQYFDEIDTARIRRASAQIHSEIHQATTDYCRHEKPSHTGEGRCPWWKWVPAFAGKTWRGRRPESPEWV